MRGFEGSVQLCPDAAAGTVGSRKLWILALNKQTESSSVPLRPSTPFLSLLLSLLRGKTSFCEFAMTYESFLEKGVCQLFEKRNS